MTSMRTRRFQGTRRHRSFAGPSWSPSLYTGLSHLKAVRFGGKTGNINNDEGTIKYDWFAGYGENQQTGQAVALCVMLLHGPTPGTRANRVAFELFSRYFQISGES